MRQAAGKCDVPCSFSRSSNPQRPSAAILIMYHVLFRPNKAALARRYLPEEATGDPDQRPSCADCSAVPRVLQRLTRVRYAQGPGAACGRAAVTRYAGACSSRLQTQAAVKSKRRSSEVAADNRETLPQSTPDWSSVPKSPAHP